MWLTHSRSCPQLTPGDDNDCTCGLKYREALADDIRAQGWTVAVHNDYRQDGESHTFWLFTKDGQAIKGEGCTDADALNQVRAALTGRVVR